MTNANRRQRMFVICAALACRLLACPPAFALNPRLDVSQYAHTAWKIRDGFTAGKITAIAQTLDGYLWLGTEFGLVRFDGVRTVDWQPPAGASLPNTFIRSLLVGRDGTLWIGTMGGVASWNDGNLTQYRDLAGLSVNALVEDRNGTIWVSGQVSTPRLCAIRSGKVQCNVGDDRFGSWLTSLYEDPNGNLWVATANGLLRWSPGPPKLFPLPDPPTGSLQGLTGDGYGALLVATRNGIRQVFNSEASTFQLPATPSHVVTSFFRDRRGDLWIGRTDLGLQHVHNGRVDVFTRADGLSGGTVNQVFEDREGDIWVSTPEGLDRFREFAVPRLSVNQGLSGAFGSTVLAARDGSVWLATFDGLDRWKDGRLTVYGRGRSGSTLTVPRIQRPDVREVLESGLPDGYIASLFQDSRGRIWVSTETRVGYMERDRFIPVSAVPGGIVNAITEDTEGNLWMANQSLGLVRWSPRNEIQRIAWTALAHEDPAVRLASDRVRGGLWLGFRLGGVVYFNDGQVRVSYGAADGLGHGRVNDLQLDSDGTLWVATDGGLSRVNGGRVATLTRKSGLPCDAVDSMVEDDADSVWLYMACGLVRVARSEFKAWATAAEKDHKDQETRATIHATVFDASDGVRSATNVSTYSPHFVKATDGTLWFAAPDGVGVVDPHHLPFNSLPPPVHIERITADRKMYDATSKSNAPIRLPALTRDLQIDYTALSLVVPEKNRFRVKLEGWDRDWQDVGNRRQAFYSNVPPRTYRFRVMASNNSGVWNEAGAFLDFSVPPAYYQTTWFRFSLAAGVLMLIAATHQWRLRQVAWQFNMRLEERVNERTRIARDLHDTLLQACQGVVLRFQAAALLLPDRPAEARQMLETALDQAGHAMTEARDAVQGLRPSVTVTSYLPTLVGEIGNDLATAHAGPRVPAFRVHVEGALLELAPAVRDEVYRIVREALRNAFRHAEASAIEIEIRYDRKQLRVRVRDDGKGLSADVVEGGGRVGHYGLAGMRERTELLNGTLTIWSEVGAGTEVELTIPSRIAYASNPPERVASA